MRKQSVVLVAVLAACSSAKSLPRAPQGEPVLEVKGNVKGGPFRLGEADLAALPHRTVRGEDPQTGRGAEWEGTAVAPLVSGRVKLVRGADTVVVRTAGGQAIAIPLTVVRQLRPVLADRADGAALPERVLAWPNLEQRGIQSDPRAAGWWARDVRELELVNGWTYGRSLAVPEGAPQSARLGGELFGARCAACHRIRKAGGSTGPDLTRVADRMREDAFAAMVARHPGWAGRQGEAPGPDSAADVWDYLRVVAADAANPRDELPEKDPGAERTDGRRR
jgi:mono/diheme cytochrome c family protein